MKVAVALIGWQLSILLARPDLEKKYPDLKLPADDEIKAMIKEAYRRFKEAIKRQREQFECMAHHR
ncbi:unnamed protein product [marine sediment metagenome]|uniref:Uncharacterized protein n=1 Tax=marine sediment metagenome TaxID=412755 RepID=X1S139_9ZZZZ